MRKSRGISQEDLAQAADISVSTYGDLERAFNCGRWSNPSLDSLLRLIIALNATSQELEYLLIQPTYLGPYAKPEGLNTASSSCADESLSAEASTSTAACSQCGAQPEHQQERLKEPRII